MRSAKLTFIGCCVAGILILTNVFMLRYVSESVKASLATDGPYKARIISQFSLPVAHESVVEDDEFGALEIIQSYNHTNSFFPPRIFSLQPPKLQKKNYEDAYHLPMARVHLPKSTTNKPRLEVIPSTTQIDHQLKILLNEIDSPGNLSCRLKYKFGRDENKEYGHETWRLCFDEPFKISAPCLVYSFGVAYDFSFDDDLAAFGCNVFSFDPSMETPDHKRESGVMFFNIGIAQRDSYSYRPEINAFNNKTKWVVKSLRSIKADLKHEDKVLDVLKLDVEGMEWVSLDQAIEDKIISHVKFLLIEWHVCSKDFQSAEKIETARRVYHDIFRLGFVKYFNDPWQYGEAGGCQMILNYFVRPASF